MSCSSLWGIKKDFKGEEVAEYSNSWLFSPVVWEVLPNKVLPPYGMKHIAMGDTGLWDATNKEMNASDNTADRICWELSNQSVFAVKDKALVAASIRLFIGQNKDITINDDGLCPLTQEQIIDRFNEIASDIEALDESVYEFFVLKATSCDDGVERWFHGELDEDKHDYKEISLFENTSNVAEFSIIRDGRIVGFKTNLEIAEEYENGRKVDPHF